MTKSMLKYDGKTDSWILNPFTSCKEATTILQDTISKPNHNLCTDLLDSSTTTPNHKPSPSCTSSMEPHYQPSSPTTQSSCRKQGKFWKLLVSYFTCFGATGSRSLQNDKKGCGHVRSSSSVYSVGSSPLHASSPGGMSAEDRDESIKAVILYCKNNSQR